MKECYCSKNLDMPDCSLSVDRTVGHHHSGFAGGKEVDWTEAVKTLMATGQVTTILLTYDVQYGVWDLYFETTPETCASKLCHYLIFEEG